MVYFEKMVASLKVNGKFIRSENDTIKLPFGAQYEIYLKNMESRDALVKISIDGKDALDSNQIILKANSSTTLEGFLEGNVVKNKFKFIELTKEIEDHLGYNPEDSIIRIEFRFVKPKPVVQEVVHNDHWIYTPNSGWPYYYPPYTITYTTNTTHYDGNTFSTSGDVPMGAVRRSANINSVYTSSLNMDSVNDTGITVKGEKTNQQFNYGYIGELEVESHVMILKLSGYKDKTNMEKFYTLNTRDSKKECPTCGRICKSEFDYCPNCGTALV